MHTILSRLKAAFPFVGERAATETDLLDHCDAAGVTVVWSTEITRGAYVRFLDRDFIFVSSLLTGWMLRYVLAHEIGHQLLHVPGCASGGVRLFDDRTHAKHHAEAEAVAAYLLLPDLATKTTEITELVSLCSRWQNSYET